MIDNVMQDDSVRVIEGPHRGKPGTVLAVATTRPTGLTYVLVGLDDKPDSHIMFDPFRDLELVGERDKRFTVARLRHMLGTVPGDYDVETSRIERPNPYQPKHPFPSLRLAEALYIDSDKERIVIRCDV